MAAQQVQFAETIRAMKLAMKRRADDSDSDNSVHAHTNRGNKLKRRSRYVREGRLDDTGGLAFKKKVNHAGYTRSIISTNPPLYDEDGDLYSPLHSEDEREAAPLEDNPFGDVQLEQLLRPLTAASELPDHPSLSIAYKSKALTQMAREAQEMVRREKEILWKAKRLLRRFRGDPDWVPCEIFETELDEMVLLGNDVASAVPSITMEAPPVVPDIEGAGAEFESGNPSEVAEKMDIEPEAMNGIDAVDMAVQQAEEIEAEVTASREVKDGTISNGGTAVEHTTVQTDAQPPGEDPAEPDVPTEPAALENPALTDLRHSRDPEAASEQTSNSGKETNGTAAPSHSMTTRARARSPVTSPRPSPTPSDSASIPPINPWFIAPALSLPDRDLGLPTNEAEETRRVLMMYVQKQEQVVRSLESLYTGLQRADRIRWEVYRACKAEGHVRDDGKGNMVTELSDGEDWYDVEDWGLGRADLKIGKDGVLGLEKGKDEVEDAEEEGRRGGRRRRVNRM